MNDATSEGPAKTVEITSFSKIEGFVFGFSQPSLATSLTINMPDDAQDIGAHILATLKDELIFDESEQASANWTPERKLVASLASTFRAVLRSAGYPVENRYVCRPITRNNGSVWQLVLPVFSHTPAEHALEWSCRTFNALLESDKRNLLTPDEHLSLDRLLQGLTQQAPAGTNSRLFLEAAYDAQVPVLRLPGGVYQFGWGRASKRFFSSSSDETSTIAMNLSRRKNWTNQLLYMAGIPVAQQFLVANVDEAVAAAKRSGYPTVLKALDRDQGVGIEPGLPNEAALRDAFERVAGITSDIAVETFIKGQDYRLNVLRGKVVGAVCRVPAGVTGDGKSTIRALVATANTDPRRNARRFSVMKPLVIDREAEELLSASDMSADSVPEQGEFVQLKRTANVSSGGHTVPVLDKLHPDNAAVCAAAADVVGLDIAGVDLIVPDIARSWRETGGGICEVNGRPQIGLTYPGIFREILEAYVPNGGHIPACLLIADPQDEHALRIMQSMSSMAGVSIPSGQQIGGQILGNGRDNLLHGTRAILISKQASAVVVQGSLKELRREGCPFHRFDGLAVLGGTSAPDRLAETLRTIAMQLRGPAIAIGGTPEHGALLSVFPRNTVVSANDPREVTDALVSCLKRGEGNV